MKNYLRAESIELVRSGHAYFEQLHKIIDESERELHIQTYIFNNDETGSRVLKALKRAAARNVQVFLMIDAYGSFPFPKDVAKELSVLGIQFRLYSPLFSGESVFFGRRLHHKIIVADRRVGLIGGLNIADKYNDMEGSKAWLDYAVLIKGAVCEFLHVRCDQFYFRKKTRLIKRWENAQPKAEGNEKLLRFRINDWIRGRNEIHKSYMEGLINAERSMVIVASYFLPGRTFRKLLKAASARGVDITVILAGKSDIASVQLAESYLYEFYLANNIRIFEWCDSVMHGKAMLVDESWATIGSYNLNPLSHYISIELNADIRDTEFIKAFSAHLTEITNSKCERVGHETTRKKTGWFRKLKMKVAYYFYRLMINILMTGRRSKKR